MENKNSKKGFLSNENVRAVEVGKVKHLWLLNRKRDTFALWFQVDIFCPQQKDYIYGPAKLIREFSPEKCPRKFQHVERILELRSVNVSAGWKAKFDENGKFVGADVVEWRYIPATDDKPEKVIKPQVKYSLSAKYHDRLKFLLAKRDGKSRLSEAKMLDEESKLAEAVLCENPWVHKLTYGMGMKLMAVPLYINGEIWGARVVWRNKKNRQYVSKNAKVNNAICYLSAQEFLEIKS